MDPVRSMVDKAIRAAVPPDQHRERRVRPESQYSWLEPTPAAGLTAALLVAKIAQQQAYEFVRALRGDGVSWREAADLLEIAWSPEYSRAEGAFELVSGPPSRQSLSPVVYWRCGGPLGCGKYITDRGPYDGHPDNDEDGHAGDCRRHAAECDAYLREREEQEHRDQVADEAMAGLAGDLFAEETVHRARWVLAHGGRYLGWSTSEVLAVALALGHDDRLEEHGYPSRDKAADRVFEGMRRPPTDPGRWLAVVRAAATGETEPAEPAA